jgi:AraC-like DNA-binding protein
LGLVVQIAERDPQEAIDFLLSTAKSNPLPPLDWPDELALAIAQHSHLRIGAWARSYDLADATVSRGFRQVYGVSAATYRLQIRARMAWRRALASQESLSRVSMDTGFSDQAHMTRAVALITGRPTRILAQKDQIDSRPGALFQGRLGPMWNQVLACFQYDRD